MRSCTAMRCNIKACHDYELSLDFYNADVMSNEKYLCNMNV